jgi:tRNA (guanosine-2'-O-)-methyltransferase
MSRNLTGTELKRLHRDWRRQTGGRLSLVMAGTQGPFNIGAVIRTAAAQRVDHVWFAAGATTPDNPKVGKTALGTDRYLSWTEIATTEQAMHEARADGYQVVGLELAEGGVPLHVLDLTFDICLVVGHEDRGLSKEILADCDAIGYIPQLGRVGSLNVATATSIAIYEVRRQDWASV